MVDYIDFDKEIKKEKFLKKQMGYSGSYVLIIIAINILVYIMEFIFENFVTNFALSPSLFLDKPWTILTHMFLHSQDSIFHIIFNMWVLLMFGTILESRIGKKRFLILYFSAGLLAGFFSIFYYNFIGANNVFMLGASGAIQGVFGALIVLMPNLRLMLLFPPVPMPLWVAGILFALIDVFGLIMPSGTANFAHLIGLIVGLTFGLYLKKFGLINKKFFIKLK